MTELEQNLQRIKDEKDTKILPENIKEGVQIFDVIGTLREGVDTSDADALASDILVGKTAYVKGEKITGMIENPIYPNPITLGTPYMLGTDATNLTTEAFYKGDNPVILTKSNSFDGSCVKTITPLERIRNIYELTTDDIRQGKLVLGIRGTLEPAAEEEAEILAELQDINGTIPD